MWLFTFFYLLFSRQGTGSNLFTSFPLTQGPVIFLSGHWGVFSALPFPSLSPASRQQVEKLQSGPVNPDAMLPLFQERFSQSVWLRDVTESGRDVTHP